MAEFERKNARLRALEIDAETICTRIWFEFAYFTTHFSHA
jgi:hypothetical protein